MFTLCKFTSAKVLTRFTLTVLAVFMTAGMVEAGSVLCPNPLDTGDNRQLEITWDGGGTVVCVEDGTANDMPNDDPYTYLGTDYSLIQKDIFPAVCEGDAASCPNLYVDVTTGDAGTFSILTGPGDYLIGFKFGGGGNPDPEPDWFIVFLSGVLDGSYELLGEGNNALSHANLWGDPGDTPQIPEPASLLLIGTGLFGAAAARRRRRAKS